MTSKLFSLNKRLSELEKELHATGQFRTTKALQHFKRQLVGELSYVKRQIELQKPRTETVREKRLRIAQANRNRSEKMKRTWRYFRALQENYYPDKSLREIRSSFKKHRDGLATEVPSVVWNNPSP